MTPLDPGEHGTLDTGTEVQRQPDMPNYYDVLAIGTGTHVELEDEEIRQLAEAAGYEVTDQ